MPNTRPCKDCELYHAIVKPHRDGKGSKDTLKGHCLDQTVYAEKKAGNPVYPPRAKVADLPYNQHKIVLVRADEVRAFCMAFKAKKG